jgi:hypothetical protein
MDETPIKAGPKGRGKMKTGYFWPVYGERDEVVFLFYPSRAAQHVYEALGRSPPADAVLISDGYSAYERYTEKIGLTHAQCWAHARRKFIQAEPVEPEAAGQALDAIGALYAIEAQIREQRLEGEQKRRYRVEQARPVVERFFAWAEAVLAEQALLLRIPAKLDGSGRQIRRHPAEPTGHLPPARRQPLPLPRRCAPAHRSSPGRPGAPANPQAVEAALCSQPAALSAAYSRPIGNHAAQ